MYVASSCLTKPSPTSDLSLLGAGRMEGGGPEEEEQIGSSPLGLGVTQGRVSSCLGSKCKDREVLIEIR